MVLVLVSIYRRYGLVAAINGASVSSRHSGTHGWETTRGEPVSAVALIYTMRDDAKQREWASWVSSFDGPPIPDDDYYDIQRPHVTPFDDRDESYFRDPVLEGTIVDPRQDERTFTWL
jgi:hypothetical protein